MDIEVATSASTPSSPLTTPRRTPGSPVGAIGYGSNRGASRKRRRSTLLGNVSSSGSDEDADSRPAAIRLRLNNLVSEPVFQPRSQSPLVHSHTPLLEATNAGIQDNAQTDKRDASDSEMDLDLEVDSCFRAMQVDSPTPSPSLSTAEWKSHEMTMPLSRSPSLTRPNPPLTAKAQPAPAPKPLSDTASVFPSSSLVASRRTSRTLGASTQYLPSAPSPLAHTTSFPNTSPTTTRTVSEPPFYDTLHSEPSNIPSQRSIPSPPLSPHDPNDASPLTTPSRRNSEGAVTPKLANASSLTRRRSQQHHSQTAFPKSPSQSSSSSSMLSGGKQMLRFTMGFREDCSLCRDKVPGHFSHVVGR